MEYSNGLDSAEYLRPTTMICSSNYENGNTVQIVVGHFFLAVIVLGCGYVAFRLSRKLDYFLVKERAPILALWQLLSFLGTLLIPYIVELAIISGVRWPASNPQQVPFTRKLAKATYMIFKTTCYMLFLPRVLVIYSNWKVARRNKPYFWRMMGNENKNLLVKLGFESDYNRHNGGLHSHSFSNFKLLHDTLPISGLVHPKQNLSERGEGDQSDLLPHVRNIESANLFCIPPPLSEGVQYQI
jgi:hypothetical protein